MAKEPIEKLIEGLNKIAKSPKSDTEKLEEVRKLVEDTQGTQRRFFRTALARQYFAPLYKGITGNELTEDQIQLFGKDTGKVKLDYRGKEIDGTLFSHFGFLISENARIKAEDKEEEFEEKLDHLKPIFEYLGINDAHERERLFQALGSVTSGGSSEIKLVIDGKEQKFETIEKALEYVSNVRANKEIFDKYIDLGKKFYSDLTEEAFEKLVKGEKIELTESDTTVKVEFEKLDVLMSAILLKAATELGKISHLVGVHVDFQAFEIKYINDIFSAFGFNEDEDKLKELFVEHKDDPDYKVKVTVDGIERSLTREELINLRIEQIKKMALSEAAIKEKLTTKLSTYSGTYLPDASVLAALIMGEKREISGEEYSDIGDYINSLCKKNTDLNENYKKAKKKNKRLKIAVAVLAVVVAGTIIYLGLDHGGVIKYNKNTDEAQPGINPDGDNTQNPGINPDEDDNQNPGIIPGGDDKDPEGDGGNQPGDDESGDDDEEITGGQTNTDIVVDVPSIGENEIDASVTTAPSYDRINPEDKTERFIEYVDGAYIVKREVLNDADKTLKETLYYDYDFEEQSVTVTRINAVTQERQTLVYQMQEDGSYDLVSVVDDEGNEIAFPVGSFEEENAGQQTIKKDEEASGSYSGAGEKLS